MQIILITFKTLKVVAGKGVNSLSPQENTKNTISATKNIIGNTNNITPRAFSIAFKFPITEVLWLLVEFRLFIYSREIESKISFANSWYSLLYAVVVEYG